MAWRKPTKLSDWFDVFLRRRRLFFFTAIPVAIAVVIASHFVERKYQADVVMEVRNHLATQQIDSRATERAASPIRQLLTQDLRKRSAMSQVIDDLQMTQDLPHTLDGELTRAGQIIKDEMVKRMIERIDIHYLARYREIERIMVSYTDSDRDVAPKVANKLIDNYVQSANDIFDRQLIDTKTFFYRQVSRYREKLQTAEAQKMRFEADHPGLDPDDPAGVDARLVELNAKFGRLNELSNIRTQERKALRKWVAEQPENIIRELDRANPEIDYLMRRKSTLKDDIFALKNTGGRARESHPRIQRLRKAIAQLDTQIKATDARVRFQEESVPNAERIAAERHIVQMTGELAGLESERSVVARQIQEYEIRKRNFAQLRNQYQTMVRDVDKFSEQLNFWDNRLRQTQIALEAAVGNRSISLTVIERPKDFSRPSTPTMTLIMLTALALAAGAAVGAMVLAELLDHSFHNVQHAVDDLKLPVLGAVNEILTPDELFRRKVMGWGVYPAAAAAMVVVLVATIFLAGLSLSEPSAFTDLMSQPLTVIGDTLFK